MLRPLRITRCRLYDDVDGRLVDISVRDGRIARIDPAAAGPAPEAGGTIDAAGRTVIPGLIDLHIHGAGGADVLDDTPEALRTISRTLAAHGTTGFLATTVPRPGRGHRHVRTAALAMQERLGGAEALGLHLEGPFVNPDRRGGLPRDGIVPPSQAELDEVLAAADGTLRMMTIAPELDGSLPIIERLAAERVIPSFGHSDASYEQTRAGITAGIRHATHLYNAMRGLHHRRPGPLVALHEAEDLAVQLISDDVHVGRPVIRWTVRIFGTERCACITDGMRTVGLEDGIYTFGGAEYESRDGAARYLDGTLIGTSLSLREIMLRFHEYAGCSFAEAVDAASRVPARVLGLDDRKGAIAAGYDADLVLLDEDRSVRATLVAGEPVYRKPEAAPAET